MGKRPKARTKCQFEIAYTVAKEKLAFSKMESLYELEELHGVGLGPGYKNNAYLTIVLPPSVAMHACDMQ